MTGWLSLINVWLPWLTARLLMELSGYQDIFLVTKYDITVSSPDITVWFSWITLWLPKMTVLVANTLYLSGY